MKTKFYYYDEQNDDFANLNIKTKKIDDSYEYLPKNFFYCFFKPLVYYLVLVLVCIIELFYLRGFIKNRKVLRKIKHQGYFVYGNHTSAINDAFSTPYTSFPKQVYIIANPDSTSIKGITTLVRFLGALPLPNTKRNYISFYRTIEKLIKKRKVIAIYPEAHIWPKYNKIRDFPIASFNYPVKLNAPCFAKTTIYKKKKNGKTKPVIYLDGPFYPDKDLPFKKAQKKLRDEVYNAMNKRVQQHNSSLDKDYEYIKVNSPEEVRTEKSKF